MGSTTDKMKNKILSAKNISDFSDSDMLRHEILSEYLKELIGKKGLKRADIVKNSGLDRTYTYHIINGDRTPSRDKLIALAFGMELNIEETDELLKISGNMPLYPRSQRDAVIIFCIGNSTGILSLNDKLFEMGLDIVE